MQDHHAVAAALSEALQAITPDIDRSELRGYLADIRNLATQAIVRIDAEVIAELYSSDPMPEHGFKGVKATLYTVDDLL